MGDWNVEVLRNRYKALYCHGFNFKENSVGFLILYVCFSTSLSTAIYDYDNNEEFLVGVKSILSFEIVQKL